MIKDVWQYVKPYKLKFWTGVFFRATSDIANLAPAYLYSVLITILTDFSDTDRWARVWPLLVIWILALYYYRIGHDLSKYLGYTTARYAGLDAKFKALRHMYQLDLAWHELENSGNKIKRIDNANTAIKATVQSVFDVFVENIVNIIGVCFIFAKVDSVITLIFIIYMLFFFLISRYLSQKVSQRYKPISQEEEVYEGLSFESINNIRTVKSLMLYQPMTSKIKISLERLKIFLKKFIFMTRLRNHILDSITRIMEYGIMFYLVYRITQNIEAVATLVLFRALFWKVIEAIWELTDIYNELLINKVYMSRFSKLMREEPTIEKQSGQLDFPQNWQTLSLKGLTFSYGEKAVLQDLNLQIKRGEKLGIVGISGAGKSTFVKLILDLYEDYTGSIEFDDLSLNKIRREDYIKFISSVSQDTELFNDSLKENILIGAGLSAEESEHKLKQALSIANLDDVVSKLPEGVQTIIGEKGFKLSGGERQRVGIARAIIRNPQIIILDEATSHLDSDSEQKIQIALENIFNSVTAIVIAHRLSTLRKMDRIIVLDQGKIVEEGSLDQLIKLNGLFAKFWHKQNGQSL